MSATTINLNAVLNFDDSNYKKGIKAVEQSLKKISTTDTFVKMKLNDGDWRKQFQSMVADSKKQLEKLGALSYKTKGGKTVSANTPAQMQRAYSYALEQSNNTKLSKAEQNAYKKREEALRRHLNLLREIGAENMRQQKQAAQIAAMPTRMAQAKRSAQVAIERNRIIREEAQARREARIAGTQALRNARNEVFGTRSNLMSRLGAYFNIYQVARFVKSVAETTGYFEKQEIALEGILGSATKAREVLSDIKDFALKSPFQTKELVDFTKQLSAFGVGGDDLFPTVTKLADISAGLGVDMSRIILAYGQVKSASVLRGQELRQFTEAGIPMVQALADKFTKLNGELVTTADVFELISKRQVSFEMVNSVMDDLTAEGGQFYKMQENLANTLGGQLSKLKDLWTLALADMGKSADGPINKVVKLLQWALKHARALAYGLATAFTVTKIWGFIVGINALIKEMGKAAAMAKLIRLGVGMAAGAIVGAIIHIAKKTSEWRKALEEINNTFARDEAKYVNGFDKLIGKLSVATEGTKAYNEAFETLKNNYGDYVNDDIIKQLIAERKALDGTTAGWGALHDSIVAAISAKKAYERSEARKDKAAKTIIDDFKPIKRVFRKEYRNINRQSDSNALLLESQIKYQKQYQAARKELKKGDIQTAFIEALAQFFERGGRTEKELAKLLKTELKKQSISEETSKFILENIELLFSKITGKEFNTYKSELDYQENDPYNLINKAFADAKSIADEKYKQTWKEGDEADEEAVKKYNPFEGDAISDAELANAAKKLVDGITKTIGDDKDYITIKDDEGNVVADYTDEYKKAKEAIDAIFSDINYKDFLNDAGKTKEIANALHLLFGTVTDPELKSQLSTITHQFIELAGTKSGRAKGISTALQKNYGEGSTAEKELKDFMIRWAPNDENIDTNRNAIANEIDDIKKTIESYGTGQLSKENKEYVELLEKKLSWYEILAGEEYYDIDEKQKKGKAETLPPEVSEFLDKLKNAYQRYKEATQKGGVQWGLEYVRNDEQFTKMFGEFFNGADSELFESLKSLRIGASSAAELLEGKFLDGLENGILDFEASITEVAKELEEYGKKNKSTRKAYLQAAKQLFQWINQTFSKDNLSVALKELEKEVKSLTTSFEKTNEMVDLYRKLQENGTAKQLGLGLGVSESDAAAPDSARQRKQVLDLIAAYNKSLPEGAQKHDIGSLSTLNDVYLVLDKIMKTTELNSKNFSANELPNNAKDIENMLKQLIKTLIQEYSSISGKAYTGDASKDVLSNATIRLDSEMAALRKSISNASDKGVFDYSAIEKMAKANQEEAKNIFDQFMNDNNLEVLGRENNFQLDEKILDDLEEKLKKIADKFPSALRNELYSKLKDLKDAVANYNAQTGSAKGFFGAIRDYRGADEYAKTEWSKEYKKNTTLNAMSLSAKEVGLSPEEIARINTELALSNERLKKMGGSAEAFEEKLKAASLERLQASISKFQSGVDSMKSAADSVVDSFKTLLGSIRKVYDMLAKGEEPEWMKEMDSFLGDFGEAFEALVAPMMAIISLVATLTVAFVTCEAAMTPLLIVMAVVIAIAAAVAGVIAAVNAKDNKLQRTIEDLEKQINDTQNAITNLNAEMERMVGYEKLEARLKSLALTYENFRDAQAQADAELAKPHKFDEEKYKEFLQNAKGYLNDFYDGIKELTEGLTFSIEDIAGRISDAMRSAFQNGTNAARDMAVAVKESIGDIVENMMRVSFLEPMLESAFETFIGGSAEELEEKFTYTDENGERKWDHDKAFKYLMGRLTDPELLSNLESDFNAASEGYLEFFNSLDKTLQDYFSYNADSSSALSGGISGITEDTARTLEGLANSMLMQQIIGNGHLASINAHLMATVQTSWFNDMLQQARATREATESLNNAIAEMRNGVRPMSVTIS